MNKPSRGTQNFRQKYYFGPEIAVWLHRVHFYQLPDFDTLLGQSEFMKRWSRPRRKHCRQWRVKGKISLPSCVQKAHSVPGSVPSLQEATNCSKGMRPRLQLHFRPAVLGEADNKGIVSHFSWVTLLTGARWALGMSAMKIFLTALRR